MLVTVLGHGILELILIIIMAFGLKDFFSSPTVAGFIGLFGDVSCMDGVWNDKVWYK